MRANLIRAGIVVLLALALGWAITRPDRESGVAIYSTDGKRHAAQKVYRFPLAIETSSLAYDDSTDVFYTTPDKGKPHIVQFRLGRTSVNIIHTDTIRGLKKNYDFEGIELVNPAGARPYLLISTERFWRKDSLVMVGVSLPDMTFLEEKSFAVQVEGMGENNNFEGVTFDPFQHLIILAKEFGPYGLYLKRPGQPIEQVFTGTDFASMYEAYIDSIVGPHIAPDRLAILRQVSFSGLAFDKETRRVLVLNRQGRAIIELQVFPDSRPSWRITGVMPFQGIDEADIEGLEPAMVVFGVAEGLAVWGKGAGKRLAIITDPGTGGQPTLYIFPYPR